MSFPVGNTLMIEPTESESKEELDRFCEAMIAIRQEIREVEEGKAPKENNILKNAPHPPDVLLSEKWDRPYSRERAAYPVPGLRKRKFWPSVSRVDDTFGDRNLVCSQQLPSVFIRRSAHVPQSKRMKAKSRSFYKSVQIEYIFIFKLFVNG